LASKIVHDRVKLLRHILDVLVGQM